MSLNTAQSELIKQTTETGERWVGGWRRCGGNGRKRGVALQPPAEDDAWLAESDPSSGFELFRRNWHKVEHLDRQSSKESAFVPPTAPLGLE